MNPIALAFSGAIGSGKSSVSSALAEALNWPRISFGDYVRGEALRQGLVPTRKVLQGVGASLLDSDLEGFCRGVLSQMLWKSGECLIIDGVRHAEVLPILQEQVAPSKLLLVFVAKSEASRKMWVSKRDCINGDELTAIESHSTETQVQTVLAEKADLKVSSDRPIQDITQEIRAWLRNFL